MNNHPMFRHGHTVGNTTTRTFRIWTNMKTRCRNPKASNYAYYGARGITVCNEWLAFDRFLFDMGECPDGMYLDRIDSDAGYSKANCRWASVKEQANNRRNNHMLCIDGQHMTMAQASERFGVLIGTVFSRLKNGWTPDEAVGLSDRRRMYYNRHAKRLEFVKR